MEDEAEDGRAARRLYEETRRDDNTLYPTQLPLWGDLPDAQRAQWVRWARRRRRTRRDETP
jgi:hypothetical protein